MTSDIPSGPSRFGGEREGKVRTCSTRTRSCGGVEWSDLLSFAERYRNDDDFRSRVDSGDPNKEVLALGVDVPPGAELRIAENTSEKIHLVVPADPNASLSDEELRGVSGGNSAASVSTVGSFGTVACAPSCLSSTSSAGSVGSASSR